ncbi:hypothetical protein BO94DRAFT_547197 [Aspergillus sclerotioniger CBS 115572]|uniref:Uncharacterized protein n=1 Tax=Aspergillus sclerotioniger CBS 115572 TaxID=1450535 RepID=A0A317WE94_9EURO|nr:hypothetical protein BO94DRAFT_547197 [Aspergillus sclerotioniger CBS 115572]PWY84609.1 hypothetical protein BO94DRAFT_547197 [Aspergillus sclerotioniger CBS 115572]
MDVKRCTWAKDMQGCQARLVVMENGWILNALRFGAYESLDPKKDTRSNELAAGDMKQKGLHCDTQSLAHLGIHEGGDLNQAAGSLFMLGFVQICIGSIFGNMVVSSILVIVARSTGSRQSVKP